ncbi:hypothetical protein BSKO_10183 [Bryopsis sp. KO-2023]|nr:hypothetical protein BSKO_10183 [Bryopsis sp. KO-2023]
MLRRCRCLKRVVASQRFLETGCSPLELVQKTGRWLSVGLLAALLSCGAADASLTAGLSSENPLLDAAKMVPSGKRSTINEDLQDFEKRTGWRLRVLTSFRGESSTSSDEIIEKWKPDKSTVIIAFDPSSPNIAAFRYLGDNVQQKLRRPFWQELQSRYGNIFFVREEGELAAITSIVNAVEVCLEKPEGCQVVPGLPMNQYYFTLGTSIAGGIVLGFASKLEPGGFITQRWQWAICFSPLWFILFVSYGLGPVVTRTDESWPILANTAGFLTTALLFQLLDFPPKWMRPEYTKDSDNGSEK